MTETVKTRATAVLMARSLPYHLETIAATTSVRIVPLPKALCMASWEMTRQGCYQSPPFFLYIFLGITTVNLVNTFLELFIGNEYSKKKQLSKAKLERCFSFKVMA